MTSGVREFWRPVLLALTFAVGLAQAASADEALKVEDVMARMRLVTSSSAHFTERRTMAMLSEPLVTQGTLRYEAPDLLVKHTLQPRSEKITVRGDLVTYVEGRDKLRALSLSDQPEVTALVESIRGTLSGDLETLTHYYDVTASGTLAQWTLALAPKSEALAALVTRIEIGGADSAITRVETLESNGDRSVMTVTEDPT